MSYLRVNCSGSCCFLPVHARPLRACFSWTRCSSTALKVGSTAGSAVLVHRKRPALPPSPKPKHAVVVSVAGSSDLPHDDTLDPPQRPPSGNFWARWQSSATDMRAQVAKLGLAAILAYGLFDGITYTTFFVLAFLGYEKSTGKNPAANIQALLGIVILMWTGNNVTRPLRVAGAAALAPVVDKALQRIQKALNLPNQVFAFMVVVATFAGLCLSVAGLLIASRWGK